MGDLTELYMKVGANAEPKYRITQPGDKARQAELKRTLPQISTAHKVADLHGIDLPQSLLAYSIRSMYTELFDLEMSLGMGG